MRLLQLLTLALLVTAAKADTTGYTVTRLYAGFCDFYAVAINDSGYVVGEELSDCEDVVSWAPDGTLLGEFDPPWAYESFVYDLNDDNQVLVYAHDDYDIRWGIGNVDGGGWQAFSSYGPPTEWGPVRPRTENSRGEYFVNTQVPDGFGGLEDAVFLYDPVVPEPSTFAMLGGAALVFLGLKQRLNRQQRK